MKTGIDYIIRGMTFHAEAASPAEAYEYCEEEQEEAGR